MDPNATIAAILADGITRETREAYNGWVLNGGFLARVEIAPHTDQWMMGDRYGTVVRVTDTRLLVKLERSGRPTYFHPSNILGAVGE